MFGIIRGMQASDLKTGTVFKDNNQPFVVVKYTHTKTARGGATVKVKAKNLLTGQVIEKRYLSNSKVTDADVTRGNAQYIYHDNGYVFMNPKSFEQFVIEDSVVGDSSKFLEEGKSVQIMYFEGTPVAIDLPNTLTFEVSRTEPGYKGNTVSNVLKDATLSNGTIIKVPTFIKVGDIVKIDTRSGQYVSKA